MPEGSRGCSWSERLTPVPGWDAVLSGNREFETYSVLACPEFVPDHPEEETTPEKIGGEGGADQSRIDPP